MVVPKVNIGTTSFEGPASAAGSGREPDGTRNRLRPATAQPARGGAAEARGEKPDKPAGAHAGPSASTGASSISSSSHTGLAAAARAVAKNAVKAAASPSRPRQTSTTRARGKSGVAVRNPAASQMARGLCDRAGAAQRAMWERSDKRRAPRPTRGAHPQVRSIQLPAPPPPVASMRLARTSGLSERADLRPSRSDAPTARAPRCA